jgi:thiol-disulfide isomerase/thioredoxin
MKYIFLISFLLVSSLIHAQEFTPADYKGKVVYLDFWASWCGPCKESFPWLNEISAKYKDRGLVVVAVNLDKDREKADAFIKQHPPTFQMLFNSDGSIAKKYGVKGMPYAVILGKDGQVLHSHVGFHKDKTKEYIQALEGALK